MDLSKAHRTARQLKAGSVWINQYNGFDTAMPFGGYKRGRELGGAAIALYAQSKSVVVALWRELHEDHGSGAAGTRQTVRIVGTRTRRPRAGEVLIKHGAAGLRHSDSLRTDGDLPSRYLIVGGHEGSGVIEPRTPSMRKLIVGQPTGRPPRL